METGFKVSQMGSVFPVQLNSGASVLDKQASNWP